MSARRFHRSLDNPINWSFSVGRLFRIDIRIHLLFVLGAFFIISQDVTRAQRLHQPASEALIWGLGTAGAMFLIVLLHELGHCFGARRVGGSAHEILLWPLGGLASVETPHRPSAHLLTAAAGPAVNLVLFAMIGSVLFVAYGGARAVPWNPFAPFTPSALVLGPTGVHRWLLVLFGLNYILFLFNVFLPIYPLDGGRILQALLWPRLGYRRSMEIATTAGMIGAIALAAFALFTPDTSLLLFSIALFGYVTCYQERQRVKLESMTSTSDLGYDFSAGFAAFDAAGAEDAPRPGWWARRKARKAAERARREREARRRRETEFDRILAKISRDGMESLTAQERRFLDEETQRRRTTSGESPPDSWSART